MALVLEVATIADLLGIDDPEQLRQNTIALVRKTKLAAAKAIPGPLKQDAAFALLDTSRGMLNTPLGSVLGQAWTTAHDLRRYCDQSQYPPGKTNEHTLKKHELALRRDPEIEVTLNGQPTGVKVQFELKLALELEGALLQIRDGRIIGARVGDARGSGSYSCGPLKLAERRTTKMRLPGALSFGDGISLGKLY